jgi:hypothetical protein
MVANVPATSLDILLLILKGRISGLNIFSFKESQYFGNNGEENV